MLQKRTEEVGMLSKVPLAITALFCVLFSGCSNLPWNRAEPANEVNLAFTIENNLLFLSTPTINHKPARILFGSAELRSVIDPALKVSAPYELELTARATLPMNPVVMSLRGVAGVLVGSDVFGSHAVTIDYRSGLLTYQKDGIHPDYMTIFRFEAAPSVIATIDGRATTVIVDTAVADTLVVPRGSSPAGRRKAHIVIAGTNLGDVDIALGDVSAPRLGNRLLSKFLVSIDYGRHEVGLWRDPRL